MFLDIIKRLVLRLIFLLVDPGHKNMELFFDIILSWEPVLRQIGEIKDEEDGEC